jgi:hypothetical protein
MAYKNDVRKTRYVLAYGVAKERLKTVGRLFLMVSSFTDCSGPNAAAASLR